jgi:PLP dependent protein
MKQYEGSADHVRERFVEVEQRVAAAAKAAGRAAADVEILVATKYVDADGLAVLRDAGVRLIGENRAQDLVEKAARYGDTFTYDFIGHLQSRKTKLILPIVRLIHSVGSLSVVEEIERRAEGPRDVLLEVNVGGEESKSGVAPEDVDRFLETARACGKVRFCGLMCMPPLFEDPEGARPFFARTRELAARLSASWAGKYTFPRLSMGTSADYEVAVQEGATVVRVGSVLF